jgi:histidine ammonia-lyase
MFDVILSLFFSYSAWLPQLQSSMLLDMVELDGRSLTIDEVVRVARGGESASIADAALGRMKTSRGKVEDALRGETAVYALNTGVGLLANVRLEADGIEQMQLNLVRSHCCGVGEPLAEDVVRAMMLIRANILAMGLSGIRPVVAERLCDLLNHGITPVVPMRGSVGASGDLAPLAHMALGASACGGVSAADWFGALETSGEGGDLAAERDTGDAGDWLFATA